MDVEKQDAALKVLDRSPKPGNKLCGNKCKSNKRLSWKTIVHCCASLCVLLWLCNSFLRKPINNLRLSNSSFIHHHRPLSAREREQLFLSIPNAESALEASRAYATHPHLAGSSEDLLDAKVILHLFQDEFGIPKPAQLPIYDAGSPESRNATLRLTEAEAAHRPTAWIDTYYPVMNTGVEQILELVDRNGTILWAADLVEDGNPGDPDAHKYRDAIPAWHGFSCDGDVTGQLIYANYGQKEDYDELVAQGTNFTGKIVLTRYGDTMRGLKIQGAQELGAAGVLIYSDPRDDGFVTVENGYSPYPAGPARNPTSVQRGSVQYVSIYPGDPTTPGYPAYENATRLEGGNMPTIPSLPISWANAERLLKEIGNTYIRTADGKYRLSGEASVHSVRLVNHVDTKVTPVWNTMASIPGYIKNEVVVIGCHRDAWVMGAADPTSGTVSLREIIRGYGALLRRGWKPLRTIVFASWDAEEYGLIGSTEWGEDFGSWISEHVVAYLNVDVSVAGSQFIPGASPSLSHVIKRTARDIPHPTRENSSLWDAMDDEGPYKDLLQNADADFLERFSDKKRKLRDGSESIVQPLGSGSDFTVFLQHLGVASSEQTFGFTPSDAVYHYHSIYDTQLWQERHGDPGFHRHVAVAQQLGLLGLRIADSLVLPLNTTQYSLELGEYLNEVEKLIPSDWSNVRPGHGQFASLRKTIRDVQAASSRLDAEKAEAEADFDRLLKHLPFPGRRGRSRHSRKCIGPLRKAADAIKSIFGVPPPTDDELRLLSLRSADSWEEYLEYASLINVQNNMAPTMTFPLPSPIRRLIEAAKRVDRVNKKLKAFERGFISEEGIKDREWYKHLGVAPGKWLGYGATTFPGLAEAILYDKNSTLILHEATRLEELIGALATTIDP